MKLALVGNCQLEMIGEIIKNVNTLHEGRFEYVLNTPIYKLNNKDNFINFYHELEQCDTIFMQYHSDKFGAFSTSTLSQYFEITLLPTMESRVSSPQLGYYTEAVPDYMVYIDYRFLHLYLMGYTSSQSIEKYHNINFSSEKQMMLLKEDALKYRTLFQQGKVYFDYSDEYYSCLLKNPDCFSTISHPDNYNLSLLLKSIYHKSFGIDETFNLEGNNVLENYLAPKIGSNDKNYFMMRPTGLALAGKINYAFFDSQNKILLENALMKSAYYLSIPDEDKKL